MAEDLATGHPIPLGKYLLGSVYHMLHQTTHLMHFLQNTVPAPRARTIAYNTAGPISALGFKSTTLAQQMSRYATMDPALISSTSDKRKAPSLVAPPAAKKKRTTKKLLIEVISLPS
jgi:hypothetical protein